MPVPPVRMAMRSDCAKTTSVAETSRDPARALPRNTRSQVSRFASRHHVEFADSSILSSTKWGPETRSSVGQ